MGVAKMCRSLRVKTDGITRRADALPLAKNISFEAAWGISRRPQDETAHPHWKSLVTRPGLTTSLSLLERARQRDVEAWRQMCDIYAPLVYGWVRKGGVFEDDAPDVVQDVFRIVASSLERFRHDRPTDTFRGWLLTITRTEVRGFFRKHAQLAGAAQGGSTAQYRFGQIIDERTLDRDSDSSLISVTSQRDLLRRAAEAVRHDFEPHTWQAFWRSVVEGHATEDIAAELKMTTNAVRQAKFRVLTRLRATLVP